MNEPVSEKEVLLMMLTKMCEQLEDVDSVLEVSFSDLRSQWFQEETEKLAACGREISLLENRINKVNSANKEDYASYSAIKKQGPSLQLDIGFH